MSNITGIKSEINFDMKEYMSYRNEDVLYRFSSMYEITIEEIEDLFQETKKFLLVAHNNRTALYINDDLLIIDEMWHNFILFTVEYQKFCMKFFGKFLHHTPASKKDKELFKENIEINFEKTREDFFEREEKNMSIIYDFYGPETVIKWFEEYPKKYTKDYILSIIK